MEQKRIYADYAATTPLSHAAFAAMQPWMTGFCGNASAIYEEGREAARALYAARGSVADCLHAKQNEIYFTSGGTESDNWAARELARLGAASGKWHIVSTEMEHHAVLHALRRLEKEGFSVTLLKPDADGIVQPDALREALRPDTAFASIMYANNEIGTLQPIRQLAEICHAQGVLLHTDAVQAAGHVPLDAEADGFDLLSLSAHKFHGPRGMGALYVRSNVRLGSFLEGGAQERGRRAGTENLPGAVGMAAALSEACAALPETMPYVQSLRERLIDGLTAVLPELRLNGSRSLRLPGNVNVSIPGIESEALLWRLDRMGVSASAGAACASGSLDESHVLRAIGCPRELSRSAVRFSLDRETTEEEVGQLIERVQEAAEVLR